MFYYRKNGVPSVEIVNKLLTDPFDYSGVLRLQTTPAILL